MSEFNRYVQLLEYLAREQYCFIGFEDVEADTRSILKSVALRYDIHLRDIQNAKRMLQLEQDVLGKCHSTSFVMFGLSGSTMLESLAELIHTCQYDDYVEFCLAQNARVEPHISPINDYIRRYQPDWRLWTEAEIANQLVQNYDCMESDGCIELRVKQEDVLNLEHLNQSISTFLDEYTWLWELRFGFKPKGFAVHGNGIALNRLLHNGVLLDQKIMSAVLQGRFEVHSTNMRKLLSLYSDCTFPYWMWQQPSFEQNALQLLVHPAQWKDDVIEKKLASASDEQKSKLHLNYPYATPLDAITNPIDFIKSGLGRYEYSLQQKSCYYA